MVRQKDWTEIKKKKKAANVKRKTLTELQKDLNHRTFKKLQENLAPWKANIKRLGVAQDFCTLLFLL